MLVTSGQLSLDDIREEADIPSSPASMNSAILRNLASVPTGTIQISDFYGKYYVPDLGPPGSTDVQYPYPGAGNDNNGILLVGWNRWEFLAPGYATVYKTKARHVIDGIPWLTDDYYSSPGGNTIEEEYWPEGAVNRMPAPKYSNMHQLFEGSGNTNWYGGGIEPVTGTYSNGPGRWITSTYYGRDDYSRRHWYGVLWHQKTNGRTLKMKRMIGKVRGTGYSDPYYYYNNYGFTTNLTLTAEMLTQATTMNLRQVYNDDITNLEVVTGDPDYTEQNSMTTRSNMNKSVAFNTTGTYINSYKVVDLQFDVSDQTAPNWPSSNGVYPWISGSEVYAGTQTSNKNFYLKLFLSGYAGNWGYHAGVTAQGLGIYYDIV